MNQSEVSWGFRLLEINVPQFDDFEGAAPPQMNLAIGAKLDWRADPQKSTVVAALQVEYASDGHRLLVLVVACTFELELLAWDAACDHQQGTIAFPREFLLQLGSITIGTARGILFERTCRPGNTCYLLPLLDVDRLVADTVPIAWDLE